MSTRDKISSEAPRAVFLGLAERAALIRDGESNFVKWNVIGLKQDIPFFFFPMNLTGWNLTFAFRSVDIPNAELAMRLTDDSGNELAKFQLTATEREPTALPLTRGEEILVRQLRVGWSIVCFPILASNVVIAKLGRYIMSLVRNDVPDEAIGEISFAQAEPLPLTPERIAAMKADPGAVKAARLTLECNKCFDKIRIYAAFERLPKTEEQGYAWYQNLPDEFRCSCTANNFDLASIKRNFFVLLGGTRRYDDGTLTSVPMYESGFLHNISVEFAKLLDAESEEEIIQKFIERNPIILHQYPAIKLYFKPEILSQYKADFGIITPQRELILIEIENTRTRLLNKDGGQAAPLGHAFDQVRSWLHVVDDHRLAVLDNLQIEREMVSSVRGVVIAGRDKKYDHKHLRRLKAGDGGRISFLTFDDLAQSMASLVVRVQAA
jgi:hypothetical protein